MKKKKCGVPKFSDNWASNLAPRPSLVCSSLLEQGCSSVTHTKKKKKMTARTVVFFFFFFHFFFVWTKLSFKKGNEETMTSFFFTFPFFLVAWGEDERVRSGYGSIVIM